LLLQENAAKAAELIRLGIIVEHPALSPLADLLTVHLSQKRELALLEREQISRVLKEQSLANTRAGDFVKLGEILGAEGLLMLDRLEREGQSLVSARLVAVKPGVVLDFSEFPFPVPDEPQWSRLLVRRLEPLLPKLGVLPKDAVPVSTLNLRSAVKTPEGEALERQLNLLLFRRLMRQKEIFVLEREKLQTAAEEKYRKGLENSAFWNGSYLLEGAIDKSGYKTNVVTVTVRLSPPAPGQPLDLEVAGRRSELADVIEKLATQLLGALKAKGPAFEWNAKEEANRYFEEAKWASRWGILPEALAASDSAWALGRRDSNCAVMRVEFATKLAMTIPPSYGGKKMFDPVRRVYVPLAPDHARIGFAIRSLEAYQEFSDTLSASEPKQESEWCFLGVHALESASQVLQLFHFFPEAQPAVADKLAELRELARGVAGWIFRSPSVRDIYWGSRRVSEENGYRELGIPNIFRCALDYGCFWQDHPEDTIALYRELMSSPVFYSIHPDLCVRAPEHPRLAVWSEQDRARMAAIWERFLEELSASKRNSSGWWMSRPKAAARRSSTACSPMCVKSIRPSSATVFRCSICSGQHRA
jgi:hypothetical protein